MSTTYSRRISMMPLLACCPRGILIMPSVVAKAKPAHTGESQAYNVHTLYTQQKGPPIKQLLRRCTMMRSKGGELLLHRTSNGIIPFLFDGRLTTHKDQASEKESR
ncbi:hypothetical protein ACRALDRAFT_206383 [Sodiomyces alcalophilus JCM 7366]|uniref:uncharacterized protein n=1 Tax=Sodiomyces alcalophilus JCM 7366 TaxID=591952 RepID=UPI0039B6B8D5